jgi:hypothetical protein
MSPGLSEAGPVMRFVHGLQLLQLSVAQDDVECCDCIVDVVRFGRADDWRGDAGRAGHPGERDLVPGQLPLSGDAGDLLDDQSILGSVKGAAELVCLAPIRLFVPVTGEPSSGEGTPGNDTDSEMRTAAASLAPLPG